MNVSAIVAALSIASGTTYSVEKRDGAWWLVAPDSRPTLSLGVCCVNQGLAPEQRDPLNPGYSAEERHKSLEAWAEDTVARLAKWGYNTIGAWSDHAILRAAPNSRFMHTPVLHLGSSGIPWKDMWDPKVVADTYAFAQAEIARHRNDPSTIGYFSDNELGWWSGAMFEWAWKATPEFGTRQRWVSLLRNRYGNDWAAVLKDFDPEGASSFDSLEKSGRLFLVPGGNGMAFARRVLRAQADRYYELCRDAIKKNDPKALFLGDRYISNFYPEVAEASARYVDVASTNVNANWGDGGIARWFLDALHQATGKPLMVTEFYACASENRSGNLNDASGFPTVRTQRERTASFKNQIEQMLVKPYVVGAHWFQFYDEPRHGRSDGENYNMGLVDIFGNPYAGLSGLLPKLRVEEIHRQGPRARPDARQGVPPIDPIDAADLARWPREEAYVPVTGGTPRGDLYVAWHPSAIYWAVHWDEDRFCEAFYREDRVPAEDRALLQLTWQGAKSPVRARIGLGGGFDGSTARVVAHQAGTRNTVVFRVAAPEFGRAEFRAGDTIRISASLDTRGRAYRMEWRGELKLAPKARGR